MDALNHVLKDELKSYEGEERKAEKTIIGRQPEVTEAGVSRRRTCGDFQG